ncbi:hypothetical protein [Desulfobulbus alkaliphilus]|uniref:hypothetical protein n=1 Tax=Desulfobulbus alkaliphilus TaxID=869814 RepID=UPI001966C581|nr:hypothetical protein [Desulfobulbus alkaliphilus]MBM9535609.1 hypothetical protein [Desulfobulbus alkaliphilus]
MIGPDRLDRVAAQAVVPEQLVCYGRVVGGGQPRLFDSCLGYEYSDSLVLIGYPVHDPWDEQALRNSVDTALTVSTARRITVLAASRPPQAGVAADEIPAPTDAYLSLPIPNPAPGQKLRNILRRAQRELHLEQERTMNQDHTILISRYLQDRILAPGTRHIFAQVSTYLATCPSVVLISARMKDGRLAGYTIGDFSSLTTAFYMFTFRDPDVAPPGTADLLLLAVQREGEQRGQLRVNLGLGINPSIAFFKKKWGATPFLPCQETSWERTPEGWLYRMHQWWRSRE